MSEVLIYELLMMLVSKILPITFILSKKQGRRHVSFNPVMCVIIDCTVLGQNWRLKILK